MGAVKARERDDPGGGAARDPDVGMREDGDDEEKRDIPRKRARTEPAESRDQQRKRVRRRAVDGMESEGRPPAHVRRAVVDPVNTPHDRHRVHRAVKPIRTQVGDHDRAG
jgi:hypothetical protein